MATGDISRNAFEPKKHYSGVRMQQGRVITDDDWNENERIGDDDRRRARVDIIGRAGSPDDGFNIHDAESTSDHFNFEIAPGIFYLGGLRLESEKGEIETYLDQKDWLQKPGNPILPVAGRLDLVYLEAWQQPVSAIEDNELFEVALGGPDTSTRMRTMRRVKVEPDIRKDKCEDAWATLRERWKTRRLGVLDPQYQPDNQRVPNVSLKVTFDSNGASQDPCQPDIQGGYLGAENQTIRVQLTGPNKFTWGFNNASPLYRVEVAGNVVTMKTQPKDHAHWPLSDQIVEILPRAAELPNGEKIAEVHGKFFKVASSYNPDEGTFTLDNTVDPNFGKEGVEVPDFLYLRVWDRGSDKTSDAEIYFTPGGDAVELGHTGLKAAFTGKDHVPGDYWIIAVRPEAPDEVIPWILDQEPVPPNGIRRYFAPLAIIKWIEGSPGNFLGKIIPCRKTFKPLTELEGRETCCAVTVGDNVDSVGDYPSIEEALGSKELENGGKICVLQGVHKANITISERTNIQISGCGENTIIHPDPERSTEPVFLINNSRHIRLENMTLVTAKGTAVRLEDIKEKKIVDSKEISIVNNRIIAWKHAVEISVNNDIAGGNSIYISNNKIGMLDKTGGGTAVSCLADDVLINGNRIVTLPEPVQVLSTYPRNPDDKTLSVFKPDTQSKEPYTAPLIIGLVEQTFLYISGISAESDSFPKLQGTAGGVQILEGSEHVKIIDNLIICGSGNGIAFKKENKGNAFISEITIQDNRIRGMTLSGIGTADAKQVVENLTISNNTIQHCAQKEETENIVLTIGGIVLGNCEDVNIAGNRIENNGKSHQFPICGIYIHDGENIDIRGNRIMNNGPLVSGVKEIKNGERGGIVIKECASFGYKDLRDAEVGEELAEVSGEFGIPALRVHDNIVTQPLGQALTVTAMGPVSVVNNQFTTRDIYKGGSKESKCGSAVYIWNLGRSQNVWGMIWLSIMVIINKIKKDDRPVYFDGQSISLTNYLISALSNFLGFYYPCGNVMFNDNQTTIDLKGKEISFGITPDTFNYAFSSQLIYSLDDVSFTGNQSDCNFFIDFLFTNTAILAASTRISNNRFKEGLILALFSLFSVALVNTTSFNQATHCLFSLGTLRKEPQGNAGNIVLFDSAIKGKSLCQVLNKIASKWGAVNVANKNGD